MTGSKHVVVVGAGVIGLSAAYYALKAGHRVTIIDRGFAGGDCCSMGNAGMVVPSHFVPLAAPGMIEYGIRMLANSESPFAIKPRPSLDLIRWGLLFAKNSTAAHVESSGPLLRDLNMLSRRTYESLATELGDDFGFTKRGLLMLCKTKHMLEEEARIAQKASSLGIEAEVITASAAADLEPGLQMDISGAVYYPNDGHLTPQVLVSQLISACASSGAGFQWNTDIVGWNVEGRKIISASSEHETFVGDEFIIAGGAWSQELVRSLGLSLPLQSGKGYSMTLTNPRQIPRLCALLMEARVSVTPMGTSLRFGGTMEIAGLDRSINQNRVNGIIKSIPNYFPEFSQQDFSGLPIWSGLRPCSPDGLPYIGRFGKFSNLIAATGHSMMGVSLAPITGQLTADILGGIRPIVPIEMLSPDRYSRK